MTTAEQPRGTLTATRPASFHKSVSFKEAYDEVKDIFHKFDSDNNGNQLRPPDSSRSIFVNVLF